MNAKNKSPKGAAVSTAQRSPADYLIDILNARVYDVAIQTPLQRADKLSARLGHTVLLKREDLQPVFSFKLRGAYNKMAQLSAAQRKKGVICASAGNHAQGVALSAQRMGVKAVIVMPVTTPQLKVDAVRQWGAEIVLVGESYSDAYEHAKKLEAQKGLSFIHPFDDPAVIAGQGTIALEMLRQHPEPIDAIFVAIGGGGLIAGVANCVKAISPTTRIIGVQMNDSAAMMESVAAGHRLQLSDVGLFSDGTAVKMVGEETFRIAQNPELVDEYMTVGTDAVCAAIKDIFDETRVVVEPAGALAVAAMKQYAQTNRKLRGQTWAAIVCGANMNFDRLRFVAERAQVGEEREALFAFTLPEERGSFKRFCEMIDNIPAAQAGAPRSVTEFNYRMSSKERAHVLVGLSTQQRGESKTIVQHAKRHGFAAIDLTHDDLARDHVRHMVGGASALATDERLLSFVFPERPGALMRFLSTMPPGWNISLFHYRNQGGDAGRILVGIQVPPKEHRALHQFLNQLGYSFKDETDNPVYQLFLRE